MCLQYGLMFSTNVTEIVKLLYTQTCANLTFRIHLWKHVQFPFYKIIWSNHVFSVALVTFSGPSKHFYTPAPPERGYTVLPLSVLPSVQDIFLSNYWWHKSDIWSQASYSMPFCGKRFWTVRFLLPVCRLNWFLYTLNIYCKFRNLCMHLLLRITDECSECEF